ncbi:MAG: Nramp family divalent metal transporter [Chloroflexi bacterium]|nr:Nramp family divalent metal transporter [Chloroflexota bacterium]
MEPTRATANVSKSQLEAWTIAPLIEPPLANGFRLLGVIGPGAILLGLSIGSGEWLLGPAAFVQHGPTLLWVTTVAVVLQTVLNTELIRYTMYTGEPIFAGFMRTKPASSFWAIFYSLLCFFQVGWPGWAGTAAGAIFYLFIGRLAGAGDADAVYQIGVATFLTCVCILLFGGRIERTLEILNWILVVFIFAGLIGLCIIFVAPAGWFAGLAGLIGYDLDARAFNFLPIGADWSLIGAFAAYSGAGGVVNLMLSGWARDKGFGMGAVVGYIPAAVGSQRVHLAHPGSVFPITPANLKNWRAWWRIALIDQWGVFGIGALLCMLLTACLYIAFIPPGKDIRGLGIAAELANAVAARGGVMMTYLVALLGAWILFKTQLDILDGMVRAVTDILWTGSRRVRAWRGGDVRVVYYAVLAVVVAWGLIALRWTQPIILLELGANISGVVFVISGAHVLYLNTTVLPVELRPPVWRRVGLIALSVFYGIFVWLWLMGGFVPDPTKGFVFQLFK